MRKPFKPRRYRTPHARAYRRFTFDDSWRATIAAITHSYLRLLGRGSFTMRRSAAGAPAPFLIEMTLPDGRSYSGLMRKHLTEGKTWYEGFLDADRFSAALLDDDLNAEGAVPKNAPPRFNLWPRQCKINPAPVPQNGKASADFLGTLWVSASDGSPGGALYAIVAHRGVLVEMKGYVTAFASATGRSSG